MKPPLLVILALVLLSSVSAQTITGLDISKELSIKLNPIDESRIRQFYIGFPRWVNSLQKDGVPSEVINQVRLGNFCIRKDIWLNLNLRLLDIEVGFARDPSLDPDFYGIELDSNMATIFEPISRPRDSHHILTLIDADNKILLSSRYILQAYSPLEVRLATSPGDETPFAYYVLNESSFGGGYSLERLVVLTIAHNAIRVVFDQPILEKEEFGDKRKDYHCIYDVSPERLTFLRIDAITNKETIEHYRFTGHRFVLEK